jgi:putative flippase GtrA
MKLSILEIARYAINGLIATAVHFGVLIFNIEILDFKSTGIANFIAAIFGISASYLGSRYFVFNRTAEKITLQALRFGVLYSVIAVLHGAFLWVWTDWNGLDYRIGFVIATIFQVSLSYFGNKLLVFKN